jgi:hypothetical protein
MVIFEALRTTAKSARRVVVMILGALVLVWFAMAFWSNVDGWIAHRPSKELYCARVLLQTVTPSNPSTFSNCAYLMAHDQESYVLAFRDEGRRAEDDRTTYRRQIEDGVPEQDRVKLTQRYPADPKVESDIAFFADMDREASAADAAPSMTAPSPSST